MTQAALHINLKISLISCVNTVISKRYMHRVTNGAMQMRSLISKRPLLLNPNRGYADEFKCLNYSHLSKQKLKALKMDPEDPNQKHLATHGIIVETKTKIAYSLATSSDGKSITSVLKDVPIVKLSDKKLNGTFVPAVDKTTGNNFNDSNADFVPDPKKGGQYLAILKTPRLFSDRALKLGKPKYQEAIDQNEAKIKHIHKEYAKTDITPITIDDVD